MTEEVATSSDTMNNTSNGNMNKLKLSRRNTKGQLTRTLRTLDNLCHGNDPEIVSEYIKTAKSQFNKVEEKHGEMMELIDNQEDFELEEQWMYDCETDYVRMLLQAKKFIAEMQQSQSPPQSHEQSQSPPQSHEQSQSPPQSHEQSQSPPQSHEQSQSPPQSHEQSQSPSQSHEQSQSPSQSQQRSHYPIQLPAPSFSAAPRMSKMKFPNFDGDIKSYMRFKQLFQHCTKGMSEIETFYQLTESMLNSADRNKIKGCINLERAWRVLDEYYGDQDKLVDSLLEDLENLKTYERKGKIHLPAMHDFVQTLQTFKTQAETIGLGGELNSKIMLSQVKQKLPEEHRIAYYKGIRDEHTDDTLTGLVKWLHGHLMLLEKAKTTVSEASPSKVSKASNAAVTVHKHDKAQRSKHCPMHPNAQSHYLKACNGFKSLPLDKKYKVMKQNSICFLCGHDDCTAGKPPFDKGSFKFARPCQIPSCGSDTHFTAICPVLYGDLGRKNYTGQQNSNVDVNRPTKGATTAVHVSMCATNDDNKLQGVLPTVMGYLRHGNQRNLVRILLDDGSQATLLRKGIVPKSDHGVYQDHNLTLVGGTTITQRLRLVECHIEDLEHTWSYPITLTEIEKPCGNIPIITTDQLQQYSHLSGVDIDTAPSETIDILLGVDNTHLMVWKEYILGERSDDPIAVKCPFGWFVQGGRTNSLSSQSNYVNVSAIGPLEDFIGLEKVGLEPKKCTCMADSMNTEATKAMQQSVTQRPDGSYEIQLPWRKPPTDLPDNYPYAVKRLQSLEKQFANRPEAWETYCKQIRDQLNRGVARHVSEDELRQDRACGRKMWFLPHFAVLKDSKTTPVRVVYDAKARYLGHSLNDYLVKGDNINAELFDVALRFRENEIGLIADISKVFQAIKIRPDDARFHRYVFRENPSHTIQVYELTTVTFGDKPSPTAAIVTLRHVVAENAPDDDRLKRVINEQFYMDDLNESVTDVKEALDLKTNLTETLAKGNFAIRKWQSNAEEVCDKTEDSTAATVLGTKWDLQKDTLKVKEVEINQHIPTKRTILSQTASYYDVFGMLSGVLIRPKILLQKLWQLNIDWDTPLNPKGELCTILNEINRDLEEIATIEIQRCLIPEQYRGQRPLPEVSLHGASDASEDAMGIGVWLRWSESVESKADLSFVCARARLTPLKQTSMPRKELQAILLLSRLMLTVKRALRFDISYTKIWTDSMTAISWLRGQSKSFRSYVAYRVGEITSEFDPITDVAYVPSEQNAIDLVSRGGTAAAMKQVIEGPEYLKLPPKSWPKTPTNVPIRKDDEEQKKFHVRNAKTFALKVNNALDSSTILDATKFSSWTKLKMVTARVLSMKELPKHRWLKDLTSQISQRPSIKLVREAELYWIRQAQRSLDLQDPNIMKLDPFFDEDEGVYRVGGRVDRAPLSYDIRHPYLLPKKSHISTLIVCDRHQHALHGGHLRTASEVRKNFWIIGDINISKRVIHDCITCRRHRDRPAKQRMADLPDFRVTPCSPPFKTTLVDYLGPVNVKLNRNTTTKGYCAVFTCAVTRAVHLTCVQDASTQAFLQAFERFVSIRGAPSLMVSDNGSCFRGAYNTINELNLKLDCNELRSHGQSYNVEWKFGPPGGPHFQGAVERMVQEVKKGMRHLVKADKLTFPEWETVFCQISGLINSRPLTSKSSSPLDDPPLTPNHFLIGRGDLPCPTIPYDDCSRDPRKRRSICNAMVEGFWKRWMTGLHKLSPRQKWQKTSENLSEKDIVLVIEDNAKRGTWKMAEVINVYPGKENLVRTVEIKLADGTFIKRPVTKLILLMKNTERADE